MEYLSNQFKNLCTGKEINVHFTIPQTPEQNGVVETCNKTIMDMARCLIFETQLGGVWQQELLFSSTRCENTCQDSE